MSPEEIDQLRTLARIGLLAFTIVSVALPIIFAAFSHGRWKETDLGRSIMFRDLLLATILIFAAASVYVRTPTLTLTAAVVLYWVGAIVTADRIRIMVSAYTNRQWPYQPPEGRTVSDKKPRPVLILMSTLVGVDVVLGGAALRDFIDDKVVGLLLLILAGVKVGLGFYLQGKVVPFSDVAAFVPDDDRSALRAGPAAPVADDEPVRVVLDVSHGGNIPEISHGGNL